MCVNKGLSWDLAMYTAILLNFKSFSISVSAIMVSTIFCAASDAKQLLDISGP